MNSNYLQTLRSYLTKKRIIWGVVILIGLLAVWFLFFKKSSNSSVQTAKVLRQDIKKTVLTTGQVVSSTDLSLSFQGSGVVRRINVKEGDTVYVGQTLAVLDQGTALAALESAKGALEQAQANYDKIKAAATPQDIAVSQATVNSASIALQNAKQNLLTELSMAYNNANTVVLSATNILFSNPNSQSPQFGITGTVQTNGQAVSNVNDTRVAINNILSTWQAEIATLNDSNTEKVTADSLANLSKISDYLNSIINILTSYTQITSGGSQTTVTSYQGQVTTGKGTVDTAYSAVLSDSQAVKNAMLSLASAQASLQLKTAPARQEDVSIAEAQVLSAQGQVHQAESNLNNTIIVAPQSGTVTEVDVKLGEQAQATKPVIHLLNVGELHTEAQVSEADIASLSVGQAIDNTFDALGPDKHFASKVLTINPASTVVSGVVNYKVTGSLDNIPGIKPGMTSNMTILVAEKSSALTVPSSAIINKNGQKVVRIVDDPVTKTYHEANVTTDLEGDGGQVEVVSGLTEGEQVVTYIK